MKKVSIIIFLVMCLLSPVKSRGQEHAQLPSKLQLAVEPEEIVLTKGITVGAAKKNIQIIVRETSGINNANLELVARPFTNVNTGDIIDANIVTVDISTPQASLAPGGLQQVKLTIGGFEQAGSYIGGITIHDTVSGEQKEILIRVSVKDSWGFPTFILLVSVLMASGVNYWTKKGRRKNRLDQKVAELQKTIKLAGGDSEPLLFDAEQFLEKAHEHNQEYQFDHAEAAIAGVQQKLAQYEQKKQGSEQLQWKIQELLNEVRELGESDPQSSRISDKLIYLLPKIQSDYEQTDALVKQLETFFKAYRLARKDLQSARERLVSNVDYVKKADKSKIQLLFRDIERILASAESMSALDEANTLLQKVAFELSPEKINENIFREQKMRKILEGHEPRIKRITGTQVKRIVMTWYENTESALEDNRYEDMEESLQKLEKTLSIVEKVKLVERRIKGRDQKMTELRRIIRNSKNCLENASWEEIQQAEWDVQQVEDILEGIRDIPQTSPFAANGQAGRLRSQEDVPHTSPFEANGQAERLRSQEDVPHTSPFAADGQAGRLRSQEDETPLEGGETDEEHSEHLRLLTREDLQENLARLLEEAAQYPKWRDKMSQWKAYCDKLIEFDELQDFSDYLRLIQDELELYARIQSIRSQAEEKNLQAVLKLTDQAEHLLLQETQDERGMYQRAEVLADAAKALLDEKWNETEFDQVISYIRSPKTTSNLITYGTLSSYFVIATVLGMQILYAPDPDFGTFFFKDYLSLVLWAVGLEGAKITVTNVYETYFKKEG